MSETASEPVRICLLVDDRTVTEWQRRAVERAVTEADVEISLVVSNEREDERTPLELVRRAIELREWTLVWAARTLFGTDLPTHAPVSVDELGCAANAERIDCVPETVDGWKNELPDDVVRTVGERADLAVRFGFGFLVGDVLTEPEHGVWSYHHGDVREYRGQPPGCWEFIHGRDEAGVTLQRLSERLDAGEVVALETVPIGDARTHREIRARLYDRSEDLLATAVDRLATGRLELETPDDLGEVYTMPDGVDALRFLVADGAGHLRERRDRTLEALSPS